MKRIHIVGSGPRTRTTLMLEVMRTCFAIDLVTEHEDRIFSRPPKEGTIYLTKAPKDVMVVGPLLQVDPDLYVIYMIRDPRDSICSRHNKAPDRYWAGLRYWKTYAWYGSKLGGHPHFFTIRYEDFVRDPDSIQEFLAESMPFLRKRYSFSRYHEVADVSIGSDAALRGVRPIAPASVGKWHDHLPRVKAQILIHGSITEDLIKYGYESDDSWEQVLDGVEPDFSRSYWPEHFSRIDLARRKFGKYTEVIRALMRRYGLLAQTTDLSIRRLVRSLRRRFKSRLVST